MYERILIADERKDLIMTCYDLFNQSFKEIQVKLDYAATLNYLYRNSVDAVIMGDKINRSIFFVNTGELIANAARNIWPKAALIHIDDRMATNGTYDMSVEKQWLKGNEEAFKRAVLNKVQEKYNSE